MCIRDRSNDTTQAGQITALQSSDSTQNTNITNLQTGKLDLTGGTLSGTLNGTVFSGTGTSQLSNLRVGSGSSFGGGTGGMLLLTVGSTPPTSNPTGGAIAYGTSTALEVRQQDGTILNGSRMGTLQGGAGPSVQGFNSWTYDTEVALSLIH